jgi:hypothetical protein
MSILKVNPESYSEVHSEDSIQNNWAAEYAKREIDNHRDTAVLDHPDGSVTEDKLSDEVKGIISKAEKDANTAVNTANTAVSTANTATETANTATETANTAVAKSEAAQQRAISADTKSDAAVSSASVAVQKAESVQSDLSEHISDTNIHTSAEEKQNLDARLTSVESGKADTSYVEDKISEVNDNISEEANSRVDADNLLKKRIDNIKYYGDADANPTPDDWFTFSDEAHTILTGLAEGYENETDIVIPNTVTTINSGVFSGCSSLTNVTIPDSVTTIDDGTFYNCSSLTSVTIPNSVTTINTAAFKGCSSLTSITIPNSVTSINSGVFENTGNLTIYCSQHSYADTYAQTNNIPVKYTEVIDGLGGFWGLDLPLIKTITLEESVTSIDILSKAEGIKLQEFTVLLFIKCLGDAIEDNSISNCIMCLRANGGSHYFGYAYEYSFWKDLNAYAAWHTKIYDNKFALTDLYKGKGTKMNDVPYMGSQGLADATTNQSSAYTSFPSDAVDNLNVFISNSDVSRGAIIPQGSMVFLLGR